LIRDHDRRVLLGLRKNEPAKNCWFVPGSHIRKNEDIRDAFTRIAKTELGFAMEFQKAIFLGVFEHKYLTNFTEAKGFGTHYIVLAYESTIEKAPRLRNLPSDQHVKWDWFTPETLLRNPSVHDNTKAYFMDPMLSSVTGCKDIAASPV
jgi:colanic acid biosynthesis protein WcaH